MALIEGVALSQGFFPEFIIDVIYVFINCFWEQYNFNINIIMPKKAKKIQDTGYD